MAGRGLGIKIVKVCIKNVDSIRVLLQNEPPDIKCTGKEDPMRIITSDSLQEGMTLSKNVYAANGLILLKKGTALTNSYIDNLKKRNIPVVYIEDEYSKDIECWDAVDSEIKAKAVFSIKEIFEGMEKGTRDANKSKGFSHVIPEEQYYAVKSVLDTLVENLNHNKGCLMNMIDVMSTDLYTYTHSVNVAILSIMTARSMQMNEKMVMEVGMGALLHDVGKIRVPQEILNKPNRLEDFEFAIMKEHSWLGYEIVKENYTLSAYTKNIVLKHHERLDGSGYPFGIDGDKMESYVRIVALCDVFDAMVSDRCYRDQIPVYEVLETINSELNLKFDAEVYQHFIKNVTVFPPGTVVQLNTGEVGIVLRPNPNFPSRPKLRLIKDPSGEVYSTFRELNMAEELTVFITGDGEI